MYGKHTEQRKGVFVRKKLFFTLLGMLLLAASATVYLYSNQSESIFTLQPPSYEVTYDTSVSETEKTRINRVMQEKQIELTAPARARIVTSDEATNLSIVTDIYVPVTNIYSVRQTVEITETPTTIYVPSLLPESIVAGIKRTFVTQAPSDPPKTTEPRLETFADDAEIPAEAIAFIPASALNSDVKLLAFRGSYYLDDFSRGALFREVVFETENPTDFTTFSLALDYDYSDETILKMNMTGVTALTREMMNRLSQVGDPTFFSDAIGEFLADADITHVSNEVSFKENCGYSYTLFCSPPEFIETLKASGVDLVELTGNHNNDLGRELNTATIDLYESLGWSVVGGGRNAAEAAKPYEADQKGTKLAVLAYNFPDSPSGLAIATTQSAGANSFDFERIEQEITSVKETSDFVIVNVQFWECYSYPDGYVEYPICDKPINQQEETFKRLIDLGADMVVGTSAHQPQTYEIYEGKPIYYGLGNMYFEQTNWPGTERGIVLTHYFNEGKLLQTKLTPTVYGRDYQPRKMTPEETNYLLTRLRDAR